MDKIFVPGKKKSNKQNIGTLSTSSSISTAGIERLVEKLRMRRNRESTQKNYYNVWRLFNEFYIKLDIKPETWEERLILFVGYLIDCNKKSTTIKSYISAIRSVLKEDNVEMSENRFLLTSLTRACRYINNKVRLRLPISKAMLKIMLDETDKYFLEENNQPFLGILYKSLFSTAYHGLFRVGELTSGSHPVKAHDVHIGENKNKMLFVLRSSKTHWKDEKPQTIKITGREDLNDDKYCPFNILRSYIEVRPKYREEDEPFFIFKERELVRPRHMRGVLKLMLKRSGFDNKFYNLHSF